MKKYFAVAFSILAIAAVLIFATISIAQAPAPKKNTTPTLPQIDATSAQTLGTLAGKILPLEQQQTAIANQLKPLRSAWNATVGQAIAKAKDSNGVPLDPCAVTVTHDGKNFLAQRQSGAGCK